MLLRAFNKCCIAVRETRNFQGVGFPNSFRCFPVFGWPITGFDTWPDVPLFEMFVSRNKKTKLAAV